MVTAWFQLPRVTQTVPMLYNIEQYYYCCKREQDAGLQQRWLAGMRQNRWCLEAE